MHCVFWKLQKFIHHKAKQHFWSGSSIFIWVKGEASWGLMKQGLGKAREVGSLLFLLSFSFLSSPSLLLLFSLPLLPCVCILSQSCSIPLLLNSLPRHLHPLPNGLFKVSFLKQHYFLNAEKLKVVLWIQLISRKTKPVSLLQPRVLFKATPPWMYFQMVTHLFGVTQG